MEAQVDALIADLRTQGDILFPGEPELIEEEAAGRDIPIDAEALADMKKWSAKLGIPPPTEMTA
jgi:hypothetical protein